MEDFVLANLNESRNEWSARLISTITPHIIEGVNSMLNESVEICKENGEHSKYLMTFQNLLARIPQWNATIIEEERKRIIDRSGCAYLEDLIACVHIIQLKILTCIRVSNKQKMIDISIPKLDGFIHKIYIHTARKLYQAVYLFDRTATALQTQRNRREIDYIIQGCVLSTIRDSIPTEAIIRAYIDESVEHEDEVSVETIPDVMDERPIDAEAAPQLASETPTAPLEEEVRYTPDTVPAIRDLDEAPVITRLSFNPYDSVLDGADNVSDVSAPKTLERLEEISVSRAVQRKLDEDEEDNTSDRIKIHLDDIGMEHMGVFDLGADEPFSLNENIELVGVEDI
jgi:Family of unknown function (DUF5764)